MSAIRRMCRRMCHLTIRRTDIFGGSHGCRIISPRSPPPTHTLTHTHTHTHTHSHSHTCARAHTRTHTCTCTQTRTDAQAHTYARTTHKLTRAHAHTAPSGEKRPMASVLPSSLKVAGARTTTWATERAWLTPRQAALPLSVQVCASVFCACVCVGHVRVCCVRVCARARMCVRACVLHVWSVRVRVCVRGGLQASPTKRGRLLGR